MTSTREMTQRVGVPSSAVPRSERRLGILSMAALGVVYGDIGTSPLYALRACFSLDIGLPRNAANVYGVLSLIVWSLILIVTVDMTSTVKYHDDARTGRAV